MYAVGASEIVLHLCHGIFLDESSVQQKIETSEMTQKENETQRLSRKPSKRPVTMETPLKHLPMSVFNRLREMDAGQLKNADKLAEVIGRSKLSSVNYSNYVVSYLAVLLFVLF